MVQHNAGSAHDHEKRRPRSAPTRAAVLAVVATALWCAVLPVLPGSRVAEAQTAPPSRPVPPPVQVTITDTGYEPASVTVAVGQSVVFTNRSATDQSVDESTGVFASGPIKPAGAFTLSLAEPGYHEFATATAPKFAGSVTVGRLEISGLPDRPVRDNLPEIWVPPMTDADEIPDVGIMASRTRVDVAFADTATVAQANAALADAGVTIVGSTPALNTVVVTVADAGVGQFDPVFAAEAKLQGNPAVEAAGLDLQAELAAVPPVAQDSLNPPGLETPTTWEWSDQRNANGSGAGAGGNWGMEASRFPGAWNILDPIRRADAVVDTLVIDRGFAPHDDLDLKAVTPGCIGQTCAGDAPAGAGNDHAMHVSGIIGARWANPMPNQSDRAMGVDGANPVVRLYGTPAEHIGSVSVGGNATNQPAWSMAGISQTFSLALDGKAKGNWPNLRVVNMSLGALRYATDPDGRKSWGRLMANRRCGPGENDDNAAATGPCTPSTHDLVLRETRFLAAIAIRVGQRARQLDVTMVVSSGNESNKFCIGATGAVSQPSVGGACAAGSVPNREDARNMNPWGRAANSLGQGDANPFVIVGAYDVHGALASFSNNGADVVAPGVDVLSTTFNNTYSLKSGTSMAAPHVSGLVGYLLAADPLLTSEQLRHLLRDEGYAATGIGAPPRIDAYNAVMALPNGPGLMLDVNDTTADGNRRVIRSRTGPDRPDTVLGDLIGNQQTHTTGDNHVDMRDFRRYRDAVLQACADAPAAQKPDPFQCPTAAQVDLDGGPQHLKKDLNFDGCVYQQTPTCGRREEDFSRFDFNGDGTLSLDHQALLPLNRATRGTTPAPSLGQGELFSDLELLQAWWDTDPVRSEGHVASDLPTLINSGDLEVHADALFQGGADRVDVTVGYGTDQHAPQQTITGKGGQVVVTVPVPKDGGTVTVSGTGYKKDGSVTSRSFTETVPGVRPGSDRRVDLCAAVVTAVPKSKTLFADGQSSTDVNVAVQNCGQSVGSGIPLTFQLRHPSDATPPAATLATATSVTDANGRSDVAVHAGGTPEDLELVVLASVENDPTHPGPEQVTQTVDIDVTPPPRVVYKWEQVTTDWQAHVSDHVGTSVDTDYGPATPDPLVISRSGSVQQVGDDVLVQEHVGPDAVPWTAQSTFGDGTTATRTSQWVIPTVERVPDRQLRMSQIVTNPYQPDGKWTDPADWTTSQGSMEVEDDRITVQHFADIGKASYRYDETESSPCDDIFCFSLAEQDQLGLVDRLHGSSLSAGEAADDPLTFRRLPNGSFSTRTWCSAPKTFAMRGSSYNPAARSFVGQATSSFRFIATVTTDPTMTGDDLVLPENCVAPVAPVASFSRDVDQPIEGRVVKFLDTSTDQNGDVAAWAWDFGDGATSTEQDPSHRYDDDGVYRVTLTVTDGTGLTNTTTADITVKNGAPEVSAQDVTVKAGEAAIVNLRLFDPSERDQEYLKLRISWNDGAGPVYPESLTAGGAAALDLGALPTGSRQLRLDVTDKDGASASTTVTVTVGDAEPATPEAPPELETPPAPACTFGVKLDEREQELHDLLTGYRSTNQLDPVFASPTLTAAATAHARWLRDNGLFQHAGDGGSTPDSRAMAAGYPAVAVGENLARGPRDAYGALVAWKMSKAHDANLLDRRWNAVGIAAVDTEQGTIWVLMFGPQVDCPLQPPNFDPASDPPDPVIVPAHPNDTEVLAAGQEAPTATSPSGPAGSPPTTTRPEVAARTMAVVPVPASATAPTTAPAPAPAAAAPPDPMAAATPGPTVVAFTVSSTEPATGDVVTITNRSSGDVVLEPGDGRPGAPLAPGASTDVDYLDPGAYTVRASEGEQQAVVDLAVTGTPRPPVISYTGPTSSAFGAHPTISAALTTTTGAPVVGRTVEFRIEGRTLTATTGADGVATAILVVDQPPGAHELVVEAPPLPSGPGASTAVTFTVGANAVPVVDAHGPYDIVLGEDLPLDTQGTTDPDGAIASLRWDLDQDGEFDDATGSQVVPAATVASLVCGGTCDPAVPETIALRAVDDRGAETVVQTVVTFRRDFTISLTPSAAVLNPNGQTSFQVLVSTTSGFSAPVQLTAPSLPPGVTAVFQPQAVMPGEVSLLTLQAAADVQEFNGEFRIRGTSGTLVRENPGTIDVEFGLVPLCYGAADIEVLDAETGAPVVGALVYNIYPTDATGHVRLDNLSLGPNNSPRQRSFSASAPGYGFAQVDAVNGCGVVTPVVLRLPPLHYGQIQDRVVVGIPDPNDHTAARKVTATDAPVPGAYVTIGTGAQKTVDSDGRVSFTQLALPFDSPVVAAADGYSPERQNVSLRSEDPAVLTQALVPACTGAVDVRVRDGNSGLPLSDVDISGIGLGRGGRTGTNGRALITDVLLGPRQSATSVSVNATASIDGIPVSTATTVVVADCGMVAQVDLSLTGPVRNFGALQGTVTNSATGAPMPGLLVHFDAGGGNAPRVATTDAQGRYTIDRIYVGNDAVTFLDGYASVDPPNTTDWLNPIGQGVRISKDQTTTKDLTVVPRQYVDVDVHVVDAANGDPVAGASVDSFSQPIQPSDADGYARFHIPTNNRPFTFFVRANAAGFIQATDQREVQPGTHVVIELRLNRVCAPATVQGLVKDASTGLPLPDALVAFNGPTSKAGTTGADGRFRITGIDVFERRPTTGTLTASKVGYQDASQTITLFCGGTITVNLGSPNTGSASLSGRVTRADNGQPVPGVVVGGEWGAAATSDADGRYTFSSVPLDGGSSRVWSVSFVPPYETDLAAVTKTVTVQKDQAAVLDAELGPPPPNRRPVAEPFEVVIPASQNSVDVVLRGSDPDGDDPLTYRLTSSAPAGTFGANQTYPSPQVHVVFVGQTSEGRFSYVVSDGRLDSAPAEVVVRRAAPANNAPTALVDPVAPVDEGSVAHLDASRSTDSDGTIVAFDWDLDGDGQFDDAHGASVDVPEPESGVRTAAVQVTDDDGATATASVLVTVHNVAPNVDAGGDASLGNDRRLARSGSFTDPGSDTWTGTVDWGEGGGSQPLVLSGKAFTLDHTYGSGGTFTVSVEICDDDLGCGHGSFLVTVPPPADNRPPTAVITGGSSVAEGSSLPLSASSSADPDGSIVAYEWDLDGDGAYDDATGASATLPAADDASVTVGLRVRDEGGAEATTTKVVTITNVAPAVDAGGDRTLASDRHMQGSGSFVDPGADTWTATVDWGDGGATQPLALAGKAFSLDHTYTTAGTFTATVEVCDDDHGCGSDSFSVTVPVEPPAAHANLGVVLRGPDVVEAGAVGTWTADVRNAGPDAATDVVVTISFPPVVAAPSATGLGWTCAGAGPITCTTASMGSGITGELVAHATAGAQGAPGVPPGQGSGRLTMTVQAAVDDPDHTDNEAAINVTVAPPTTTTTSTTTSTTPTSTTTSTAPTSTTSTTSTTSATTSTTAPSTTSTSPPSSTSTSTPSTPSSTSSTIAATNSGSSTTSTGPSGTSSNPSASSPSVGSVAATGASGSLPITGSSPLRLVLLALGCLVAGSALMHHRRGGRNGPGG